VPGPGHLEGRLEDGERGGEVAFPHKHIADPEVGGDEAQRMIE
jgi:hypothetical protein